MLLVHRVYRISRVFSFHVLLFFTIATGFVHLHVLLFFHPLSSSTCRSCLFHDLVLFPLSGFESILQTFSTYGNTHAMVLQLFLYRTTILLGLFCHYHSKNFFCRFHSDLFYFKWLIDLFIKPYVIYHSHRPLSIMLFLHIQLNVIHYCCGM